jgi:hypothetical protein
MNHNNPKPQPTGMSLDEATTAMSLIHQTCEREFDGSQQSLGRVIELSRTLIESPETFWSEYFASPASKRIEAAISSGDLDPNDVSKMSSGEFL